MYNPWKPRPCFLCGTVTFKLWLLLCHKANPNVMIAVASLAPFNPKLDIVAVESRLRVFPTGSNSLQYGNYAHQIKLFEPDEDLWHNLWIHVGGLLHSCNVVSSSSARVSSVSSTYGLSSSRTALSIPLAYHVMTRAPSLVDILSPART